MFKVALLQMNSCGTDQAANLAKGEAFCREAAQMGADVALFPEMWNIGYPSFDFEQPNALEKWHALAIAQNGSFVNHFQALAQELDMAIALTYLEQGQPLPRNSASLIDRHGVILFTYAKVHTCDFHMEAFCKPGDDFYVADLDTKQGTVKIGIMICYDREFPESARILMLKGAEIILTPNACPLEENRIGQFRARAYENMVGVAMANYAAPQFNGHSVAFDAVCFNADESSRDTTIIASGEAEGVYLASFDMAKLRDYRQREALGNAYRKVSRYALLTATEVAAPFVRPDARR